MKYYASVSFYKQLISQYPLLRLKTRHKTTETMAT